MQNIRSFGSYFPELGTRVFVDASAVVTGQVVLADEVSIWPHSSIRGDLLPITIGARSNIQDGCVLHTTHESSYNPEGYPLTIGTDVTVGHGVILHGCTVHDFCLIGMGSIVLDAAIIEPEVMLGAGSLVAPGKILASGFLYHGHPAKKIRALTASEKEFLRYSALNYVKLKELHLAAS